jgi:hypothetical protein
VARTQVERESLTKDVDHLLEECRMVLPGVQALFGFQLVAVFSHQFFARLGDFEHMLHIGALFLTAVAAAMLMAPAAYHRQAEPGQVSDRFVAYASTLLTWAMVPLMLGLSIDMYVITMAMFHSPAAALVVALALLTITSTLWFVIPRAHRASGRERASGSRPARRLPAS